MMDAVSIRFSNVSKEYSLSPHLAGGLKRLIVEFPKSISKLRAGRFKALQDISFEVRPGECLGVIGRNGAGKSTLLGMIAGVLDPTVGKVEVNGRVSPMLELGAGFHPELTGRENIELNGVLMGLSRKQIQSKLDEIVEFSELGQFIDQPIRTYSSGMMARLGFSVIAHLEPEILLIDEVLAVGDAGFQKKCSDRIEQFRKKGVTCVLVSHSVADIERLCNRVLWIENHKVRAFGGAAEVLPKFKGEQTP